MEIITIRDPAQPSQSQSEDISAVTAMQIRVCVLVSSAVPLPAAYCLPPYPSLTLNKKYHQWHYHSFLIKYPCISLFPQWKIQFMKLQSFKCSVMIWIYCNQRVNFYVKEAKIRILNSWVHDTFEFVLSEAGFAIHILWVNWQTHGP